MARLPRAVEDQGKRADELLKQFGVSQNQALAVTPAMTPTPAPVTPDPAEYVNADQPDPAVQPSPDPVTPIPPTPAPQTCPECDKNKHRYSVLQGKYDAEVPRLTYRTQYLENQIADLNAQTKEMAGLVAAHQPSSAAVTTPATPATSVFSEALKSSPDETIKNFRENFPDVFGPMSKILDDFGNQISKKSEDRIALIEKTNSESKQDAFSNAIAKAHPDWQAICQGDPNWPIWLNKADSYGLSKLMALRAASSKYDPQAVINLLSDFKKENAVAPAQPLNPAQNPNTRFVSPGSGPSGPGGGINPGQGPEPVARSFIQSFARDVTMGKYRGKEVEMNAIQAKIDAAVSAGKILNK